MINVRMKYAVGGVMSDIAEGIGKKPFVPPRAGKKSMKKAVGTAIVKKSAEIDFRRAERPIEKAEIRALSAEKVELGRTYFILQGLRQAQKRLSRNREMGISGRHMDSICLF